MKMEINRCVTQSCARWFRNPHKAGFSSHFNHNLGAENEGEREREREVTITLLSQHVIFSASLTLTNVRANLGSLYDLLDRFWPKQGNKW